MRPPSIFGEARSERRFNRIFIQNPWIFEDARRLRNHLLFPAALLAKDLIFFAVYLTPFFSREVEWRGGRIALGRDTLILVPANVENLVYEGA